MYETGWRPTMICPDRDQRAQSYTRAVVRKPDTHSHRVVIIFNTQLNASLGASGCFRYVCDVEDVGNTAHESHGARSRVEIADLALEVVNLWLPRFGGSRLQCIFELFWGEAISDGGAGGLLCRRRGCRSRMKECLYGAVFVRACHGVGRCFR
jgi:hypothetical protein